METVKKTISLKIRAAQNPKRNSLIQTVSELKKTVKKLPIRMGIDHARFEKRERARHRLKLKTASFFMKVLLIKRSVNKIIRKSVIAIPIPKNILETDNSKSRLEITESIMIRIRV